MMMHLKRYGTILKAVFWYSDTTTIRAILAWASFWFALGLVPNLHTFDRAAFAAMRAVAPQWLWACMFMAHWAGVMWRLLEYKSRPGWAFFINAFGLVIWIVSTCLVMQTVGEYTPGAAMELTVIVAAFVALVRTGLNREQVTP